MRVNPLRRVTGQSDHNFAANCQRISVHHGFAGATKVWHEKIVGLFCFDLLKGVIGGFTHVGINVATRHTKLCNGVFRNFAKFTQALRCRQTIAGVFFTFQNRGKCLRGRAGS